MARNFSAEVAISTAKAKQDIRTLRSEVEGLDKGLLNLNKTLKDSNGNLAATSKSIAAIVQSSREAAKASQDLAKAKQEEAKAQRMSSDAASKQQADAQRSALNEQKLQTEKHRTAIAQEKLTQTQQRGIQTSRNYAASQDALGNSLSNTRYLLYDVGATYRTIAIAGQVLSGATIAVAASYEKAFAQVIRTSGETAESAAGLRSELKQMGTEIPQSFQELAKIAQIGGQLGIATAELGSFTETVAKFQATADGVTIDQATQAFGRLQNLFNTGINNETLNPEFFRQIGAAISYTGDNSVTSEKKILAMLDKMAAVGKQAGLSATEVTALASAMSSVGIAPELGRSAIQRVFGTFAQTASRGGPALADMAAAVKLTNEEFQNLVATDPNALMNQLLDTMQDMSAIEARSFLDRLGIKGVRDQAVISALSGSLHVFKQAQDDVNEAFLAGTYLDTSSAGIFNTMTANLQKLMTAFQNLGDSIAKGMLPHISDLLSFLTPLVQGFANLIDQNAGVRMFVGSLLSLGSLVGIFAAVKAAQSFLMAGMVSFQHVAQQGTLNTLNLKGQMTELARTMLATRGASAQTGAAILGTTTGIKALTTAAAASSATIKKLNADLAQTAGTATTAAAATHGLSTAQKVSAGSAATSVAASTRLGTAVRGIGSAAGVAGRTLLTLAGGPIGIAIAAIGALTVGMVTARQEAVQTADAITEAFAASEEAGTKAIAAAVSEDGNWFTEQGRSIADNAEKAGVSIEELTNAIAGGEAEMTKLRDRMAEVQDESQSIIPFLSGDKAFGANALVRFLDDQIAAQQRAATEAENLGHAQNALGVETDELSGDFAEASSSVDDWRNSLNKALDDVFALVNAEIALDSALRDLGEGLSKTTAFGVGDENAEANLQNLQAVLQAEAELLNQAIADGQLSAQGAADQFAAYTEQLMSELTARGVDPAQIQALASDAVYQAQDVFAQMGVESAPSMPVTIDASQIQGVTQQAVNAAAAVAAETPITADMNLEGADEAVVQTYNTVAHIAAVTGQPFDVVLQALTGQAISDIAQTGQYAAAVTNTEYTGQVNMDTTPGLTNIQNLQVFAANVLNTISSWVAGVATDVANVVDAIPGMSGSWFRGLAGAARAVSSGARGFTASMQPPKQYAGAGGSFANTAPAPPIPTKTLDSYDQAKRGLDDIKQGYDGLDNAAKKAGGSGKKAGNDIGKGAKKAAKDVQSAAEALDDYASRLSDAFSNIYKQTYGVQEANDAYYDQLYKITKRRNDELRQVWELTRGIRQLTEERRGEVIEAEKFERMSALAAKHGNSERAKDYANEAAQLRESAAEKQAKIDEDQREIKVLQQGRGQLNGYSQAAIKNRAELRALEKATTDIIVAHARAGATTSELDALTRQLTGRYQKHVGQMGRTYQAYGNVRDIAQRYSNVIKSIPRTVSTKASLNDGASGKARGIKSAIGSIPSSKNIRVGLTGSDSVLRTLNALGRDRTIKYNLQIGNTGALERHMRVSGAALVAKNQGGLIDGYARGGLIPGQSPANPREDNLLAEVDGQGLIQVRSQEYIVSEPAVDYYGTAFMDKLNKMQLPRYYMGGSPGRSKSTGDNLVDLSPETLQTFVRAIQQLDIALYADAERLADTVNNGRELIAQKGGVNV